MTFLKRMPPNIKARRSSSFEPQVDDTGARAWLVSGRRRQLDRLVRGPLCRVFSPCCPSKDALTVVAGFSPLVEVGARAGYWSRLLAAAGASVVALDPAPHGSKPVDGLEPPLVSFYPVERAGFRAAGDYPRHTLLFVWPRQCVGWNADERDDADDVAALRSYKGRRVVFVGNRSGNCAATSAFHDELEGRWRLQRTVAIPCWPGQEADVSVWVR